LGATEKEAGSHFGNNCGRERWNAPRDVVGLMADALMADALIADAPIADAPIAA
jgi:hypothetical protein